MTVEDLLAVYLKRLSRLSPMNDHSDALTVGSLLFESTLVYWASQTIGSDLSLVPVENRGIYRRVREVVIAARIYAEARTNGLDAAMLLKLSLDG